MSQPRILLDPAGELYFDEQLEEWHLRTARLLSQSWYRTHIALGLFSAVWKWLPQLNVDTLALGASAQASIPRS